MAGRDVEAALAEEGSRVPTFTVAFPLVPLVVGQTVDRAAWPPHITVLENFRAHDAAPIASAVERFAATTPPIRAAVQGQARFGPDRAVLVDLVEAPLLRALHRQLLGDLESEDPDLEMDRPLHARDGFRPHRTVAAGPRPSRGDFLEAGWIALAELDPSGEPGIAVIRGLWPLGGTPQRA